MGWNYLTLYKHRIPYEENGYVRMQLEMNYSGEDAVTVPSGTLIEYLNFQAPINGTDHDQSLIDYSADLRQMKETTKTAQDMEIVIPVDYSVELYDGRDHRSSTTVTLTKDFKLKPLPLLDAFFEMKYFLNPDGITWSKKRLFDVKKAIRRNAFNFYEHSASPTTSPALLFTQSLDIENAVSYKLAIDTKDRPKNLTKEIRSMYDLFVPTKEGKLHFVKINLFDDLYPGDSSRKGHNAFDNDMEFFRYLLENKSFNALISKDERSSTSPRYLYHFRAKGIYVKSGVYYMTIPAYELMKLSVLCTQATSRNDMTASTIEIGEMLNQVGDAEEAVAALLKGGQDTNRQRLVKVAIVKNFTLLHDLVRGNGSKHLISGDSTGKRFNKMLAFHTVTPGQYHTWREKDNVKRRAALAQCGLLSDLSFNLIQRNINATSTNVQTDKNDKFLQSQRQKIQKWIKENDIKYRRPIPEYDGSWDTRLMADTYQGNLYTFRDGLSPSSPDKDNSTETYLTYATGSSNMFLTNLGRDVPVVGVLSVDRTSNITYLQGGKYVNLIDSRHPLEWTTRSRQRLSELDIKLLNFSAQPYPPHLDDNNEQLPYQNLVVTMGKEELYRNLREIEDGTANKRLLVTKKIYCAGTDFDNESVSVDLNRNDMNEFFKKYPCSKYAVSVAISEAIVPTKMVADGAPPGFKPSLLFVRVNGIHQAPELIHGNIGLRHLGIINLTKIENWENKTNADNRTAVTFSYQNNEHVASPFQIESYESIQHFTLSLVSDGQIPHLITYDGVTNKRPQYTLIISVYEDKK